MTVSNNLEHWYARWKDKVDSIGKQLCSRTTEKAVREQCKKAQYIQDSDHFDPYLHVDPKKKSKMQLPTWISRRPESWLENFHKELAHFGNTGMAAALADALTLRGTAEHNLSIRHQYAKGATPMSFASLPQHYQDTPFFTNHSKLQFLNLMSETKGLGKIFSNLDKLPEDNGERFLSE